MSERDYVQACKVPAATHFLPGTSIEIVRPRKPGPPPKHALFDFDGTLSLVREGWMEIMVPQLAEHLLPYARQGETAESITRLVRDFVTELTGKQTIYQMIRLAEEIRLRGGTPAEPQAYKDEYHHRLMARIDSRRQGLADGTLPRTALLVPGSLEILKGLQERGTAIYIASGTDEKYVLEEARLLGLDVFAPGRIYGAQADHTSFSKEMVIRRILQENAVTAHPSSRSVTAMWRLPTAKPSAVWPSPWPATRPHAPAAATPGSASGSSAQAQTSSSPITGKPPRF